MSITISHPFRALTLVSLATVAAVAIPAALRAQDGPTAITPAQQVEAIPSDPCGSVGRGLSDSIEARTQACRADVAAAAERSGSALAGVSANSRGFDPCGSVGQGLSDSIEARTQACRADVAAAAERASSASASVDAGMSDSCDSVGQGLSDSIEARTQACRADVAAASSRTASAFDDRMDDDPEFAACVRNATAHPEVPEHWYGYCAGK